MTSTSWTLTVGDGPPLALVDLVPGQGPGARDVAVADWPFGGEPMPAVPRSYPAVLERREDDQVVQRITGRAWSPGIAHADGRGVRFRLRFVPDLVVGRPPGAGTG